MKLSYLFRRGTVKVDSFFHSMSSISKCDHCDVMNQFGNYLGRGISGDAFSGAERSTLVLGPSRSGKTSCLIIPNLLMTEHGAVTTSTKNDVVRIIASARTDVAHLLFDPSGTVPVPPGVSAVGFSPIKLASTWDGSLLVTRSLSDTQQTMRSAHGDDHWTERSSALLAPLLHAAALNGTSLSKLARSVDERKGEASLEILRATYGDTHQSVALLSGILSTEQRELSGIWSNASGLLTGLRTDAAQAASRRPELDVDEFIKRRAQLHIVAPSRYQAITSPLIVGLIDQVVHHAYAIHHEGHRLLLALDELANVAPLPQLPSIISEGGGQGVTTLAALQDLSQPRRRWGVSGDSFLSLFPTAIIFPGIADRPTLDLLAGLGGRMATPTPTHSLSRRGKFQGVSWSHPELARATVADIAQGRPGMALGVTPDKHMQWIGLTPYYRSDRFVRYLDRSTSRDRSR